MAGEHLSAHEIGTKTNKFSYRGNNVNVVIDNSLLECTDTLKYLDVTIHVYKTMTWGDHIKAHPLR